MISGEQVVEDVFKELIKNNSNKFELEKYPAGYYPTVEIHNSIIDYDEGLEYKEFYQVRFGNEEWLLGLGESYKNEVKKICSKDILALNFHYFHFRYYPEHVNSEIKEELENRRKNLRNTLIGARANGKLFFGEKKFQKPNNDLKLKVAELYFSKNNIINNIPKNIVKYSEKIVPLLIENLKIVLSENYKHVDKFVSFLWNDFEKDMLKNTNWI